MADAAAVDPSSRPAGEAVLTEIGDGRRAATRRQAGRAGLVRVGARGQASFDGFGIDSGSATLGTVATIPIGLGQQPQDQSIELRRRAVESRAAIDVLDLDDPAAVPPDGVDRMDPVTPVANETAFDDLRHVPPGSFVGWALDTASAVQVRYCGYP